MWVNKIFPNAVDYIKDYCSKSTLETCFSFTLWLKWPFHTRENLELNTPKWEFSFHITCNLMLPHRFFFLVEGVIWQELQDPMLHSFPGFESNFLGIPVIPRHKGAVYLTPGIHQQSLLNVSFFVLYTYPHWNQHGIFVCLILVFGLLGFFPHLLFFSFLLSLLGNYFTESKSFNSPGYLKQQPCISKKSKYNVFGSSSLSSCKLQNFPNIVYRIIAKGIRPICAIGSRTP